MAARLDRLLDGRFDKWEQRAERLMRGKRGLHTRLWAHGVSCYGAGRVLGVSAFTVCYWGRRTAFPKYANAMRLRALVHDVARGLELARLPDGFYVGTERPNLSAWLDEAVAEGWTLKGIAARSGVRSAAVQAVRHGGGISLPNGLRLAAFLRRARAGTIEPTRRRPSRRKPPPPMPGQGPSPYAGLGRRVCDEEERRSGEWWPGLDPRSGDEGGRGCTMKKNPAGR